MLRLQAIRDPELIFLEVQTLNMKDKIAQYWWVSASTWLLFAA